MEPGAERFREEFLGARRRVLRAVLARGVDRGDLPTDLDAELVVDMLAGTAFWRAVVMGRTETAGLTEQLVDLVIDGRLPRMVTTSAPSRRTFSP